MYTSVKSLSIALLVFAVSLWFSDVSFADRIGTVNSNAAETIDEEYAYKISWPNGISVSDGVLTVPSIGGGGISPVESSATNISLSESDNAGGLVLMTAAGEVGFPDCDTDLIGWWVSVLKRDDTEQVELAMVGDTTNDLFRLKDGTELDADDEADMATAANQLVTVMCVEENKWYIISEDGACTDGGVAD